MEEEKKNTSFASQDELGIIFEGKENPCNCVNNRVSLVPGIPGKV